MLTRERPSAVKTPPAPPPARAERSWLDEPFAWLPAINREVLIFAGLMIVAAVLRFWDLGSRAQHHDESLHAIYSWYLYTGRGFSADPLMHGPFLFHVTALIYFLFGDNDYTSRIMTAVAGTALVGMPYFLRSYLGRSGAVLLAVFFLFSPSYLYYSRFIRQEATLLLWTLIIATCLWLHVARPRPRYLIWLALALSLSYTDKATTYFTVGIFGSFLFLWKWRELFNAVRRPLTGLKTLSPAGEAFVILFSLALPQGAVVIYEILKVGFKMTLSSAPFTTILNQPISQQTAFAFVVVTILLVIGSAVGLLWNARLWWKIAAVFYIPFGLLYTTMLTNLPGFGTGIWGQLFYWMEQHGVQRGNQPQYYYLILMSVYEFLPVILGLIGIITIARWRRIDPFGFFLIFWAVGSLVAYSLAGEKMPWLVVHPTMPFMLLGARALGGWLERFPTGLWRRGTFWLLTAGAVLALVIVGLFISIAAGVGPRAGDYPAAIRIGAVVIALALIAVLFLRTVPGLGAGAVGRSILVGLLIVGFSLTVRAAWQASFYHGDIPVEMLVYTQTSPDVPVIANRIRQTADLNGGRANFPVTVDSTESFTWPWAWYLRDFARVDYPQMNVVPGPPIGSVLLVHSSNVDKIQPFLDKYGPGQKYRLRWWFPEDYRGIDFPKLGQLLTDPGVWRTWWKYFLYRDIVNPLGSSDGVVFFPKDQAAPIVAANQPPAAPRVTDPGAPSINPPVLTTIGGQRGNQPGQLNEPKGVVADSAGNLYVVDSLNHRLQKFDPDGQLLVTIGGEGQALGQFKEPWGIGIDKANNIYVADTWNHRVQKFDSGLNPIQQWGGFGDTRGVIDANPGQFYGPRSVVAADDGSIYVTDTGNKRIQRFTTDGAFVAAYGGPGSEPGKFQEPVGLATDAQGNIYVADTWNKRIQKFDPTMKFVAAWPVPGWNSLSVINKPYLAVTANGNLYAADPENKRVFEFGPDGQVKAVIGGPGGAALTLPIGVAAAPDGNLWVADSTGHKVQKFNLAAR